MREETENTHDLENQNNTLLKARISTVFKARQHITDVSLLYSFMINMEIKCLFVGLKATQMTVAIDER